MASIKVKGSDNSWNYIYSKAWIKTTSSIWSAVKKIYVNSGTVWNLVWPKSGPYTTESPAIRLHTYRAGSSSGSQPPTEVGDVIQMGPGGTRGQAVTIADGESGTTYLWGYDGTWAANTSAVITRAFYYNSSNDFLSANAISGVTDQLANTASGVGLRDSKYLWYSVEETNSTGTGQDNSNPLFIIKQKPAAPSTFSLITPGIATVGVQIDLSYTIQDNTTYWYKNADLSKSYIEWFAESSVTSNPTNLISGSKVFLNAISSSYSGVTASFTPTLTQKDKYIYAKITLINSYSTYYNDLTVIAVTGTNVTVQASTPPTVNSYPTLSGTPSTFSSITASAGSYSNYTSITTKVTRLVSGTPTQGSNDDLISGVESSNPYTVTQYDATNVSYTFYARDQVLGTDGKTYYYYSAGKKSDIGIVTDDFSNRTLTSGVGTMSSGFTYSGPAITPYPSGQSWRVSSGYGISDTAVGSTQGPSYWPLRSIEMGGKSSVYVSVDLPGATGGLGVAFWAASNTQWWSARCFHIAETASVESCTGAGGTNTTGAPTSPSSGAGSACNVSSTSEYACGSTQYSTVSTITASSSAGGACSVTTVTEYLCGNSESLAYNNGTTSPTVGTGSGAKCGVYSSVTTTYACDQPGGTDAVGVTVGNGPGDGCNQVTGTTYACGTAITQYATTQSTGSGAGQKCYEGSTTVYPCNISGYSSSTTQPTAGSGPGDPCDIYSTTTYACDGDSAGPYSTAQTTGSGLGDLCGQSTSTTYGCTGSKSGQALCGGTAGGVYNAGTVGVRCGSCYGTAGSYYYSVVAGTTTYSYSKRKTATVTWSWASRRTNGTTSYNYSVRSNSGTTVYYWSERSSTGTNTTNYYYYLRDNYQTTSYKYYLRSSTPTTTYTWSTVTASNTTQYNTYVKIAAAENGSTVNEKGSLKVDSSTSGYPAVYGVAASISGNSIDAWLKDSGGAAIGGVLSISPSSPVKADSNGASAAGIIKGYSPAVVGTSFDNLIII